MEDDVTDFDTGDFDIFHDGSDFMLTKAKMRSTVLTLCIIGVAPFGAAAQTGVLPDKELESQQQFSA
jgi:hypothetical protein